MKLTIIYDNEVYKDGLKAKWGFSCLVELEDYKMLFDTGGNGIILLGNMERLNIPTDQIDNIFISHGHWDHMGGLSDILYLNKEANIYLPFSCLKKESIVPASYLKTLRERNTIAIKGAQKISDKVYSTGELEEIEQSLIINTEKGLVIVLGCAHPGVGRILEAALSIGDVYSIIGGLHGFDDFSLLENIELICPTHCTKYKSDIFSLYPNKCIEGGIGRIIEI